MPAPHGRDLEATRVQLLEWVTLRLPEIPSPRIENLGGPGATGFSSDTLMFDVVAGDGSRREWVARIKPTGYQVFPAYDLSLQVRVQRALAGTDVPVAPVVAEETDERFLGAPFYLMGRVRGRIPTDNPPYHTGGWVTEVAPEERATLWWSGLDVLARIHRLDWRALGLADLATPERGATPLAQQLDFYEAYLGWAARGKPQPTCEAAFEWLVRNQPRDEPTALCWGDARIGNMIFDGGRCAAVLDWEMVTLGNPEQDLAWWLFLDRHHSEGVGAPRLEGFPERAETVARWEEIVGRNVRNLAYYEAFAAFRFGVIMIRVSQQMVEYGVLPADSTFETDNTVTRLLAKILDLPAPGGG